MFVDLITSSNYIMVNMDAIRVFGLNSAVYTAELLYIYKKSKMKNKLVNGEYFKVDRKFITERTSLSLEDQLACDINLGRVNIISKYNNEADTIKFDIELYASLIASEDVKIVEKVIETVKVEKPKEVKAQTKAYTINVIKQSLVSSNIELLTMLRDWVDVIFDSGKGMGKKQAELFQERLNDYCGKDYNKAIEIVKIAITHAWLDCQYAINAYESNHKSSGPKNTEQRVATRDMIDTTTSF